MDSDPGLCRRTYQDASITKQSKDNSLNDFLLVLLIVNCPCLNVHLASLIVDRSLVCSLTLLNVYKHANCALECSVADGNAEVDVDFYWSCFLCYRMYIRLIDFTLRENEYLFRLNDQQKVYYIIWCVYMCVNGFLISFPSSALFLQMASSLLKNSSCNTAIFIQAWTTREPRRFFPSACILTTTNLKDFRMSLILKNKILKKETLETTRKSCLYFTMFSSVTTSASPPRTISYAALR